jgi:hypothetical protein
MKHGFGVHTLDNGNVYEGDFKKNAYHGVGTYSWKDGGVYQGEWINGKRSGKGTLIRANKVFYSGEWINNEVKSSAHFLKNYDKTCLKYFDGLQSDPESILDNFFETKKLAVWQPTTDEEKTQDNNDLTLSLEIGYARNFYTSKSVNCQVIHP